MAAASLNVAAVGLPWFRERSDRTDSCLQLDLQTGNYKSTLFLPLLSARWAHGGADGRQHSSVLRQCHAPTHVPEPRGRTSRLSSPSHWRHIFYPSIYQVNQRRQQRCISGCRGASAAGGTCQAGTPVRPARGLPPPGPAAATMSTGQGIFNRHEEIRLALRFFLAALHRARASGASAPDKQRVLYDFARYKGLRPVVERLSSEPLKPRGQ